jgi:hypothetical protein
MSGRQALGRMLLLIAGLLATEPAHAQTFTSGSDGTDGAFSPSCTPPCTLTIPLREGGIYNYTTITIAPNITVTYTRNSTNTPVTLLATGAVVIQGTIDVSGGNGVNGDHLTIVGPTGGAGGPGGFDGGNAANGILSGLPGLPGVGGAGLGPGGGLDQGSTAGGGGFARAGGGGVLGGPQYGTPSLLPLIGGSGGGGGGMQFFGYTGSGGGGGGGALLIASSGTITLTGSVLARGGSGGTAPVPNAWGGGGGSGGAIRLVATTITGTGGQVDVSAGVSLANPGFPGSAGRGRIEAYNLSASINFVGVPTDSITTALPSPSVLPTPPTLSIASVAGVAAPPSPGGRFDRPDIVLPSTTTNPVTIALTASQIPLGTTVTVTTTALQAAAVSVLSTGLTGTVTNSTASATVTIQTNQPSVISAATTFRLIALGGAGPVYVEGEEVEWVRVTATVGRRSQVAYITRSGRKFVVSAAP